MSKEFLIRYGLEEDFSKIRLAEREPGFAIDTEKLLIGTKSGNKHIPNEDYVSSMIASSLPLYEPIRTSSQDLASNQKSGTIAYNTTDDLLQYKREDGSIMKLPSSKYVPLLTPVSVAVSEENIDTGDGNSVTIAGYERSLVMVFKNGVLCTANAQDQNRISVDVAARTLKVYNCSAGDIIAYY